MTRRSRLENGEIEDELVAAELHNLIGTVYLYLGEWDVAERHIPTALEIRMRLLGKEHPITLQSRHEKTMLDGFQERYATMEPFLLEDSGGSQNAVLGLEHPDTLTSQGTLAMLYGGTGRHEEAEPIVIKTFEARKRVLGIEHRDTLTSLAHMAKLYIDMDRTDEAEPLCLKALKLRTESAR